MSSTVPRPIIAVVARPVVAVVGDDVVLPCQANLTVPVSETTVEWTRKDLTPQNVHVIKNGQEVSVMQNSVYKDRTSVFVEQLEVGSVSLRISGVKLSDGGIYTCSITSGKVEECVVQLIVGKLIVWCYAVFKLTATNVYKAPKHICHCISVEVLINIMSHKYI